MQLHSFVVEPVTMGGGSGADLFFVFCVHIRFCGHGGLWFRSYSGSLSKSLRGPAESNQSASAPFVRCLA